MSTNPPRPPTTNNVFSYGSNSLAQLRGRVNNPRLTSRRARLDGFARVFCFNSSTWNGGGVCSVAPCAGAQCHGSIVNLTPTELNMLRAHEGGYREVVLNCRTESADVSALVFVAGNARRFGGAAKPFTPSMTAPPGEPYLTAIHVHLRDHYAEAMASGDSVTVRTLNPNGAVHIVHQWQHPGFKNLGLRALCVELNACGDLGWVMPSTIDEVMEKFKAIGCDETTPAWHLLADSIGGADLSQLNAKFEANGDTKFGGAAMRALRALLEVTG